MVVITPRMDSSRCPPILRVFKTMRLEPMRFTPIPRDGQISLLEGGHFTATQRAIIILRMVVQPFRTIPQGVLIQLMDSLRYLTTKPDLISQQLAFPLM